MLKFGQSKKMRTEILYREMVEFLRHLSYEVLWWPKRCPIMTNKMDTSVPKAHYVMNIS